MSNIRKVIEVTKNKNHEPRIHIHLGNKNRKRKLKESFIANLEHNNNCKKMTQTLTMVT